MLKRIYIYIYLSVVSVRGSCLKLLEVVLAFYLHLYLVSIPISTFSYMFNSHRICVGKW